MELEFTDRYVTKKGTVYRNFIGDSWDTKVETLKEKEQELKQLIGQQVSINGKISMILDVVAESYCNLVNRNYYICVLTDEEFMVECPEYQI
jgi:hypothetical protein